MQNKRVSVFSVHEKIPSSANLALVVRYYYIFSDRLLIMSEVSNLKIGFFDPLNDFKNNLTYNRKGLESFYNDLLTGVQYNVDDFGGHFASSRIKIICFILFILCETFSNVYCILFIMFEKYGGDPLKRSVTNQVLFKRYQDS